MLFLTVLFVAIGIPCLVESVNAQELKLRYDDQCLLETTCFVTATLDNEKFIDNINKHNKKLYIYYEIKNQWQNIRRYVDSVSWAQLKGKDPKTSELNRCKPQKYITREADSSFPDDGISLPCGLQPWSFFNDTFSIEVNSNVVEIDSSNIAWEKDLDNLYSDTLAVNFNNLPAYAGGGVITTPIDQDEHFAVWMRLGTRSQFRKLYGTVQTKTDTSAPIFQLGDTIRFVIENNYNSYNFDGEKVVMISTLSFLGGQNNFTGILFLVLAGVFLLTAIFIMFVAALASTDVGDLNNLSWVKKEQKQYLLQQRLQEQGYRPNEENDE